MHKKQDLLSARQVSELLGLSIRTAQRLAKHGRIRAVMVGSRWKFFKADIERYLNYGTALAGFHNEFMDQRAYPRINCSIPCYINTIYPCSINNISAGGVFLEGAGSIRPDDPVNLTFELGKNGTFDIDGRVTRKQNKGIAVKFRDIKDETRRIISKYVG